MTRRRDLLKAAAGATVVIGTAGCFRRFLNDDEDGSGSSENPQEGAGAEQANSSAQDAAEENTTENASTERERNETDGTDETNETETENESDEPEYPEAAEPEANPEVETDNSTINESKEPATEPTADDLAITSTELSTSSSGAAVSGRLTNEADVPITVDLEVTFIENGTQVGRPALGGTTGLSPGETWNFTIRARGSEYSGVTNFEIEPVRVSSTTR